jgi:hypothetical protein
MIILEGLYLISDALHDLRLEADSDETFREMMEDPVIGVELDDED